MLFHNRFSNLNIEYMEIRFILKKYIKKFCEMISNAYVFLYIYY
jgi:hypothetical protein